MRPHARAPERGEWVEWAARKVAAKGPLYVPGRVGYSVRKRLVDGLFPRIRRLPGAELSPGLEPGAIREHLLARTPERWHFPPGDAGALVRGVPERMKREAIRDARRLADGRFTFRGAGPLRIGSDDWTLARSPDAAALSPARRRSWIWDLNRHFWFAELGFAYRYTGDERFARAFVERSASWVDRFGPRIGSLSWDTPFEVGARVNAWLWALFLFLPSRSWGDDDLRAYLVTLGRLAEYLYHTIEFHSPGNHLLLEAKALALCGSALPEFRGSRRWRRKAWSHLRRQVREQITGDGVHAERATLYHRIVAGELSELWHHLRAVGEATDLTGEVGRAVAGMADFQRWIDSGGGRYPLFGDSYEEDSYLRFTAPVLAPEIGPGPGNEGGLRRSGAASHYDRWVTGAAAPPPEAPAGPGARDDRTPSGVPARAFPEGGYYVSRSGWEASSDLLAWDCGPVGHAERENRKHAHLDALSVFLSLDGRPVLVDPGADDFAPGDVSLRGTRAHNTVAVAGQEQGLLGLRRDVFSPPEPEALLWSPSPAADVMMGRHAGYARLTPSVTHTRCVVYARPDYWLVLDVLAGEGTTSAVGRFHLAPGLDPTPREAGGWRVETPGGRLDLVPAATADGATRRLERGALSSEMRPGEVRRLRACELHVEGRLPLVLATVLVRGGLHDGRVRCRAPGSGLISVAVEGGVGPGQRPIADRIFVDPTGEAPGVRAVAGDWRTDARVVLLRRGDGASPGLGSSGPDAPLRLVGAYGATFLAHGDRPLFADGAVRDLPPPLRGRARDAGPGSARASVTVTGPGAP